MAGTALMVTVAPWNLSYPLRAMQARRLMSNYLQEANELLLRETQNDHWITGRSVSQAPPPMKIARQVFPLQLPLLHRQTAVVLLHRLACITGHYLARAPPHGPVHCPVHVWLISMWKLIRLIGTRKPLFIIPNLT